MNNTPAITNNALLPIAEVRSIAEAFAKSGMFPDTKDAAQAIVKVQAGQEMGIPPFQAMTGIHIISGKPTVGAGLMASRVKASGKYNYKVLEQTEKVCKIEFFESERGCWVSLGISTFTIEEAKKAGTKNLDRFPKNMLFARAMSNGVKWFCPDVFFGPVYVPEEFDTDQAPLTQDIAHEVVSNPALTVVPQSDAVPSEAPMTADNTPDMEWYTAEVEKCTTKFQLDGFFKENVDDIGGDAKIIALFTARRFKLVYPSAELPNVLLLAQDTASLKNLYYANQTVFEKDEKLKEALTARKEALTAQTEKEVANG